MADKTTSDKVEAKPVEKSTEPAQAQKSDLDRVVDLVGILAKTHEETQKSFDKRFEAIENSIKALTAKPKAMETPTDLPLEPKGNPGAADNDIGAKTEAPKDWYQSQSQQASITEASIVPNSSDKPDLRMEKKSQNIVTTETPRPSGIQDVLKSREAHGYTTNPILKEMRDLGYKDGITVIANKIRNGAYHNEPSAWMPYGGI